MRNIRLIIEYDGTNYNGWQRQVSKFKTIQGEIEKAILKATKAKANLHASGRTDSGVHAKAQVANFHTENKLPLKKLKRALNAFLPKDISIIKTEQAPRAFHSRFSAKSKIYRYSILNRDSFSPFLRRYSLYIPYKINLSLMKKEAKALLGRHDFTSFKAAGAKEGSSVRKIKKIVIRKRKDDIITIDIESTGFVYNMARNIVGTLLEIGRGKFSPGSMAKILKSKNRKNAGPTAPACGLCLIEVKY